MWATTSVCCGSMPPKWRTDEMTGGWTPAFDQDLKRVRFAAMETDFGPLSAASEAMLTRFFRIKVQSLHFCGRAFHDRPLIEGFRHLALLYAVIIWLARWFAVSAGRTALTDGDVAKAVARVDYHHGFSPYLPWRTRLLQQREDVARLRAFFDHDAEQAGLLERFGGEARPADTRAVRSALG